MKLAGLLGPGDMVCLIGDLGSGKTHFTQGVAMGLGISDPVSSPSYTLIQEYISGRLPLYHFDVYRLESPEDLDELGYEDYFYGEGVTVIEWADKLRDYLPEDCLSVSIINTGEESREITVSAIGERLETVIGRLAEKTAGR